MFYFKCVSMSQGDGNEEVLVGSSDEEVDVGAEEIVKKMPAIQTGRAGEHLPGYRSGYMCQETIVLRERLRHIRYGDEVKVGDLGLVVNYDV